jgi:hydroxymethylglutaryl-CoA lyase
MSGLPKFVRLIEVGPREGFQFEGIGNPQKINTDDKVRLIEMLAGTGLKILQIVSFVSPKQVPQMADAEAICSRLKPRPGVIYTGIYLNDTGLRRAIAASPPLSVTGKITLTASETFALRNQRRTLEQDFEMQRRIAALYRQHGHAVETANVMAAFGCNYEGPVALSRVLDLVAKLHEIAAEAGSTLRTLGLADTMGWADPEMIRRTVGAVRERWPALSLNLHLHDTRGLGIANVYAALLEGVDEFDTAVGGLGGCPFAGHGGAAGNVCTEAVLFLCRQLGIATGVDLEAVVECSRFAETIVGHALPSSLLHARLTPVPADAVAA